MLPNFPASFWNTLSQTSQNTAQSAEAWGYNLWQMPVCYWQTVSTIMGQRSQSSTALYQNWLNCCTQLAQCKTPTEATQCLQHAYQNGLKTLTQLNLNTHKNRAELWHNWQILAQRCTPQHTPSIAGIKQPMANLKAGSAAYTQSKGWFVAGRATPSNATNVTPIKAVAPEVAPESSTVTTNTLPLPAPAPKPVPSIVPTTSPNTQNLPKPMPMAVGQSYQTSISQQPEAEAKPANNVVSSTGNSVMRSSNGATMAAAAATRRSVLARHASRKSRLSRPR